jgi:2'-5' RNA ligase
MSQLPLFSEDLKLSEILIVIEPPGEIAEYIALLKKEIYDEFGDYTSRFSKAHITVNDFRVLDDRMNPTLNAIEKHISEISSFIIQLNGFSSFDSGKTLFVNVESSESYNHLINEFEIVRSEVVKAKKKNFYISTRPHITIANQMNNSAFKELKKRFHPLHFNHEFKVEKLAVLRKNINLGKFDHIRDINLKN